MVFRLIAVGLAWGESLIPPVEAGEALPPELVVRRCEVIAVGEMEAVTDAWSLIPLSAWYPKMKHPDEFLLLGLAKFRIAQFLKGGEPGQEIIHAAFPIRGYKAGSSKRDTFTMTDFKTFTSGHVGTKAVWCFHWDETAKTYTLRFDYQQRHPEEAEVLADLIKSKTWTTPKRSAPEIHHAGILEGRITKVDTASSSLEISCPFYDSLLNTTLTIRLPGWMTESGGSQLSASDLQPEDAVRITACQSSFTFGKKTGTSIPAPVTADDIQLLKGNPYHSLRQVFGNEPTLKKSTAQK